MSTHVPRFKNEVSLFLPPSPPKTWSEAGGCDHWKVTGTYPVCQVEAAESLEVRVHSWLHSDLDSNLIWDCLNSNNKWQLKHSEVKDRRIATSSELSTLRPFLWWGGKLDMNTFRIRWHYWEVVEKMCHWEALERYTLVLSLSCLCASWLSWHAHPLSPYLSTTMFSSSCQGKGQPSTDWNPNQNKSSFQSVSLAKVYYTQSKASRQVLGNVSFSTCKIRRKGIRKIWYKADYRFHETVNTKIPDFTISSDM